MTPLAPHLTAFLRQHLPVERRASPATLDTYAHALRLLVCYAAERLGAQPSQLDVEALDAPLVLDFLNHLETGRGNSARTRNARLAAVTSLFRYLEYRLPSCLEQAGRIRAIPVKRTDEALVQHLNREEVQALLDSPDPRTVSGARDRAMLHLAFAAGLRVSELVGLRLDQLHLAPQPAIHVMGKGRHERILPLWRETATALRAWLAVRDDARDPALFLGAGGQVVTRAGFEYILAKHAAAAARKQPSLAGRRITPHVLRHSCAMHICCRPPTTSGESLSGSVTPVCKAPKSTCGRIQQRSWRRSTPLHRRHCGAASSGRLTRYSPCCKAAGSLDRYAERRSPESRP